MIEFLKAKNGVDCAKANGIFLHSQYNPQVEAERFTQNAVSDFIPQTVIVIEGALSYCTASLRERFPAAKIGTIRLCKDFSSTDKNWDFVLGFEGGSLSEQLFNLLGEEGIYKTLFLEWPPSARAFPQEAKTAWQEIKAAIEKAKAVLATREYFGKKWLKNKIKFFSKIQNTATLERIEKPVIICASGPSLAAAIPLIKKVRQNVFVCALSSAISVLLYNDITPDLCFSTDGGYWAKKHLDILKKQKGIEGVFQPQTIEQTSADSTTATLRAVPLALATEGECASTILQNTMIVPLCYDDDALSKKLFAELEIPYMIARRNGTVSGTALEFFLANTDCDIFFAGLDLAPGTTFAHAQPNALEINAAQNDFRLAPKATRIAKTALPSPSLDLYANWFANYSWNGKQSVYRICGEEKFKNNLGKIEDIEVNTAEEKIFKTKYSVSSEQPQSQGIANITCNCSLPLLTVSGVIRNEISSYHKQIRVIISDCVATPDLANELFPTDSILASRAASSEEKQKYENIISQKTQKLLQEIFRKLK